MLDLMENKVAITPLGDPDESPGGIIIPDIAKDRFDQGVVRYVGPDVKWLKVGDYVVFSGYAGRYIFIEGEGDMVIMREDFVEARIQEFANTDIPGLYLKDPDGHHYPAPYEAVMILVTQALGETEWALELRHKTAAQRIHNLAARDRRAAEEH